MASMPGVLKEPDGRQALDSGLGMRYGSEAYSSCSDASFENSQHLSANYDTQDTESGVHDQDYNEWIFQDYGENVELDLTPDQVMATLRYFTSTADRANMLTKTHYDDLDVISNLLHEKEKDLELAAGIGQSLLQRNKNLLLKIEALEEYLGQASEREVQLCHEVKLKNNLIKQMLTDQDELEEHTLSSDSGSGSGSRESEPGCKDESITLLQQRCKTLELRNNELFTEALNVKQMTDDAEAKEQELIMDCVRQLGEAKEQITVLTDEIALKFEDNVQQQEEITELISTVVELQRNHRQLSTENEDLQIQLDESQQNQELLKSQVIELQRKFAECYELLQNNQEEMKNLRSKVELSEQTSWASESCSSGFYQDSLAMEIEETVRKDLHNVETKRRQDNRVWDTIRRANRLIDRGSDTSRPTSGRLSPMSSQRSEMLSFVSDDAAGSDTGSVAHSDDSIGSRRRRPYVAPERLQIVKPMEGSQTLHQWQHLASQNVNAGLNLADSPNSSPEEKNISELRLEDLEDDIFQHDDGSEADDGICFSAKPVVPPPAPTVASGVKKKTPLINPRKTVVPKSSPSTMKNKSSTPKSSPSPSVNVALVDSDSSRGSLSKPGVVGVEAGLLKPVGNSRATVKRGKAKPRTIITRSSSILSTLREGRELLSQSENGGKTKAEVIDIIANAMNKVNVEAKTGKRILESISANSLHDRKQSFSASPMKKDYPEMPKLTKVLEKLATTKLEDGQTVGDKPSLRDLLNKVDTQMKKKESSTENKENRVPTTGLLASVSNPSRPSSGAVLGIPSILRSSFRLGGTSTSSLLGRMVRSSSHDMPAASSLSSFPAAVAGSVESQPHRTLTKSHSSGDLQKFASENLSRLGIVDPSVSNSAANLGRVRRNSSGDGFGSVTSVESLPAHGIRRRTNSSGSLIDLARRSEGSRSMELNPSPPSFSGFDPYGIAEYFAGGLQRDISSSSSKAKESASQNSVPKVPSGFLKNLFLGSGSGQDMKLDGQKRPSSLYDEPQMDKRTKGSTASAESGLDKFGKAFAMSDTFGGLGFMSFFSGAKGNATKEKK